MKKSLFITISLLMAFVTAKGQTYNLQQCLDMAIENNRTLKSKRIDIDKADNDKHSARMNYLPKVSANAMGFMSAGDLIDGKLNISDEYKQGMMANPITQGIIQQQPAQMQQALGQAIAGMQDMTFNMLDRGITASIVALQPIYTGGQIINGNKLAQLQTEVKQLQYNMSEREIKQNVAQYYWTTQALRANIKTLDAVDQQLNQLHSQVEQYVNAGVTNRNDLLKVELKQQEMASNRLKVNNGLQLSQMVLAQLVGADINEFQTAEEEVTTTQQPADIFEDADAAVAQRDEITLTQKGIEASKLQLKMERGKNLPTIAVGAAGLYYNMAGDMSFKTNLDPKATNIGRMKLDKVNLIGMATVSVPISAWWSHRHDINKAKANVLQARLTSEDTQEKLKLDVQSAWNTLNESYAQVRIAKKSVESSTENLRLNKDYYNVGQTTMSDLLDAVTLSHKATNALTQAYANYNIAIADYLQKTR